jgi:hypothetical protein
MQVVSRISLFRQEINWSLSSSAVELLVSLAETLSEGERRETGYYGSTMFTIDLSRAAEIVREPCDVLSAQKLAMLCAADDALCERARALALADAEVRAGEPLRAVRLDVRARAAGTTLYLDVNLEAEVVERATA